MNVIECKTSPFSSRLAAVVMLLAIVACLPAQAAWQRLRDNVAQVLLIDDQIDSLTKVVVIDSTDHSVYAQSTASTWSKVGGPGSQFVEGRARVGTTVYALTPSKDAVYQYRAKQGWKRVGGPAKRLYGGIGGLFAISPNEDGIYSYDPHSERWAKIGGSGRMFAVGGEHELYSLSDDGRNIYRYLGKPGKWERIGDAGISILAVPGHLYRTVPNGDIQKYDGTPFSWTKIGGAGNAFAAVGAGDVYGISPNAKSIYRYRGEPGQWQQVGGEAVAISAHRDALYAIRKDNSLWKYQKPLLANQAELLVIGWDSHSADALGEYADHKIRNGMAVAVVSLDDILRSTTGQDIAEKIRNFLIKANESNLLRYVLLVGDVDRIPTKILFRDNGKDPKSRANQNAYSTDFYYANLHTADWDLDDDDLWGEIADDNLDIHHDVIVSRIPFNDAATIRLVARNMVDFDKERGAQWMRRVVLAHGFMNAEYDLAGYAETIDRDLLVPNGFSSDKLYVKKGKTKSAYFDTANATALSDAAYIGALSARGQGLALLAAHGATNGMVSKYVDQNGNVQSLPFGNWVSVKGHSMSGLFLLNGCNTAPTLTANGYSTPQTLDQELHSQGSLWSSLGKPVHGNIVKEYLKSGAVAVIASTVGSDAGSQVMEHEFAKRLVSDGDTVGEAFAKSKEKAGPKRDYQSFYLTGDPTLRLR